MAIGYPKRQGFLYSHKSSTVLHGTEAWRGVVAAMASAKIDGRERPSGNGMIALGVTRGELKVEVSVTFEFQSLLEWRVAHPRILTELFDVLTLTWAEGDDIGTIDVYDVTFEDMEVKSEGTESIKVEVKGTANRMELDGQDIIDIPVADLSEVEVA